MNYLPLFVKTDASCPVLIIGGGEIAAAKAEALASVGASVEIIAAKVQDATRDFCQRHSFAVTEAAYNVAQLIGRRIVIAATDDDAVNALIAKDCRDRGILVNVVDNPPLCDFIFPALVKRGALQIAISTSGIAPVLARMIKQTIERAIPASFEQLISFMQQKKQVMRQKLPLIQPRRLFAEDIINGRIAEEVLEGNLAKAEALFDEALAVYPNQKQAALYLVGAGCGNPELLTIKAVRLLSKADVVLVDRLVSPVIIEQYARKDAEKIHVGKTRHHHHKTQAEIDALIEESLKAGKIVVRLKGGDPAIYAHAAEEIAIAKRLGVPYQIVPGITAASGCAAYAGIPLTERGGALSVRFLTAYTQQLHDESFWQGLRYAHNETLVFYMSSHHFGLLCERLMKQAGFAPDTRFLAVEQGTTSHHKELAGTLGSFAKDYGDYSFASPCLIIVGDVVRFREEYHWKETLAGEEESYFAPLPEKEVA